MNRRFLLESLLNLFKWLSHSFTNLYNSLIPSSISDKDVLDKAKMVKVYGNSVVENQLVDYQTINTETKNDITKTNNNDGTFTLSGTANADTTFTFAIGTWEINHYYLIYGLKNFGISGSVYWYDTYYSQFNSYQDFIYHPTNSSYTQRRIALFIKNGTQVNFTFCPQLTDLTLMFPFNTPTSLDDVRVQALLNRGYIAHNTGTLKNVDIGTISTKDSNNQALDTISLKYQGNGVGTSNDTMEITNSDVIFTKNFSSVDLGTLAWNVKTNNANKWWATISGNKYTPSSYGYLPNIICTKYPTSIVRLDSPSQGDKTISYDYYGSVCIEDSALNGKTGVEVKESLNGVMLEYELATPQTITIPRKHLACVDLGTLSWSIQSAGTTNERIFTDDLTNLKQPSETTDVINVYISKYITKDYDSSGSQDMIVFGYHEYQYDRLFIRDSSLFGLTAQQIKEKLTGVYLYYETISEVADITDTISVEAGGTITSNWFSWNKNQLCPANKKTATITSVNVGYQDRIANVCDIINGHIYLLTMSLSGDFPLTNTQLFFGDASDWVNGGTNRVIDQTQTKPANILTAKKDNTGIDLMTYNAGGSVISGISCVVDNLQVIDLTLAFGSGNEPTFVNDPRIQYILSLGYIPTDTTGTLENVDSRVLPNLDVKVKCK
ncbi:MAG: hypothetical protein K5765_06765 [Clostridia bacterium]|nr:hypothetical protein [Clostridia bacterium]